MMIPIHAAKYPEETFDASALTKQLVAAPARSFVSPLRVSNSHDSYHSISEWARKTGVTRLAECTRLDVLGIPNFYAVRPGARHPCSIVASGKGSVRLDAALSALFECYERWAAERAPLFSNLPKNQEHFNSNDFARAPEYSAIDPPFWCLAFRLPDLTPFLVPVEKVCFPYPYPAEMRQRLVTDTNGLAAGATFWEATLHALLELIERDAVFGGTLQHCYRITEDLLDTSNQELISYYRNFNVDLAVLLRRSRTQIPIGYVLSRDNSQSLQHLFCSGAGCSMSIDMAVRRALLEVSQSRVSFTTTLRDDVGPRIETCQMSTYTQKQSQLAPWFDAPLPVDVENVVSPLNPLTTDKDMALQVVERIQQYTNSNIYVSPLDLDANLVSCRAIAPGLVGIRHE